MQTVNKSNISFIKELLKRELPGEMAHRLMLPEGRSLYPLNGETAGLQSSVLMLLFPCEEVIHTCLIRRPSAMKNHGGQIAFPGGRFEKKDITLENTAIRETFEEVGVERGKIEILGRLSPLYVQVSNFTIHPFIGLCKEIPDFRTDKREVDKLFKVPIDHFLNHKIPQFQNVNTIHGPLEVPGFYFDDLFVWGATAMILAEFTELLKNNK